MTDTPTSFDDGHRRGLGHEVDEPGSATWDDDVDATAGLKQLTNVLAVRIGDGLNAVGREARRSQGFAGDVRHRGGAVLRLPTTAQNHSIAGLETKRRDVNCDIGT